MDAFAFVQDSTKDDGADSAMESEAECRCGATIGNTNVWDGIEPPAYLLPPNEDSPAGKSIVDAKDGECDIEAFVYTGKMARGATPGHPFVFSTCD